LDINVTIQTTSNNYYLFIYLQRLHPSIQKPIKQIKNKSLSESNSQDSDNKKLKKQNQSLWTVNRKNEEKNKIKAKVFLKKHTNIYIPVYNLYSPEK